MRVETGTLSASDGPFDPQESSRALCNTNCRGRWAAVLRRGGMGGESVLRRC